MTALRIGVAAGELARALAEQVARKLDGDLVVVPDADSAAVVAAVRAGDIDAAILAASELPALPEGVVVAAFPSRADARDAVCANDAVTLDGLPEGARVGVATTLRAAQLRARRPELTVVEVGGDDATALAVLDADSGDTAEPIDAVIVAAVSAERLGRGEQIAERVSLAPWPTAPGQGALAIVTTASGAKRVAKLDHSRTRLAVEAERAVAARLGADAAAAVGADAILDDGLLFLSARVTAVDGSTQLTASHALYPEDSTRPAADLGERTADELLANGAAALLSGGEGA